MGKFMQATLRLTCIFFAFLVVSSLAGCNDNKFITGTTTINNLEWEAVAEIQKLESCDESGWEVPEDAIVYKEQEEIKYYKIIGYETKYKTEEYQEHVGYYLPTWRPKYETRTRTVSYEEPIKEPVYATKYYYTIDRWVHLKDIQVGRGFDHNYDYPEYVCNENERVNKVEYFYWFSFRFDGRESWQTIDKDRWETLSLGQEIFVEKTERSFVPTVIWDDKEAQKTEDSQ